MENVSEPQTCLNCGQPATNNFCSWCGQSTRNLRVGFKDLIKVMTSTMANLDQRVIRSIKPLLFKPGYLTQCFMAGKRVQYVHPVRLYLITSVLFFVSLTFVTSHSENDMVIRGNVDAPTAEEIVDIPMIPKGGSWAEQFEERMSAQGEKLSKMNQEDVRKQLLPILMGATSKSMFLLMPLFALILKLLHLRQDPLYIDHLIFALHYHSFLYLFYAGLIWWAYLVDAGQGWAVSGAITLFTPLYLYKAMRRVFGQDRIRTLLKFTVLWGIYLFLLIGAITVAATIAVLTV